jgi:2-keto-3-deoxy-galactonokinase
MNFTTPCGFQLYIIPLDNGTVRFRVFFEGEEVTLAALNERLSMQGLKMLGEKITNQLKE